MAQVGVTVTCVCGKTVDGTPASDGTVACGACGRRVVVDANAAARAFGTTDATQAVPEKASSPQDSTGHPFAVELDEAPLTQSVVETDESPRRAEPRLPAKLGPYRVLGRLGEGGMGVVYKGHDETLDRPVALKVLARTRGNEGDHAQLEREARSIAAVTHPNVVQVYAAGEQDGLAYFAMELVNGPDLREVLEREGPLSVARARRYMSQAALGLRAAAKKGIVHRDVKPANLLLDARDDQVKVADFGLAKRACVDASMGGTSLIAGTPLYVAPEVIKEGSGDQRADIYSLGATFFHLLAGQPPFGGRTAAQALVGHATEPAPDLGAVRSDVPAALSALIRRCMEKDPARRFAGYDELLAELDPTRLPSGVSPALSVTPRTAPAPAPAAPPPAPRPAARPLPQPLSAPIPATSPPVVAVPACSRRRSRPRSAWRLLFALAAVAGALEYASLRRHGWSPAEAFRRHDPVMGCDFADLVAEARRARWVPGELLAPVKVSQARRMSFPGDGFALDVGDTCPTSELPYAICGSGSSVLAWHVHDVRERTVVFADRTGQLHTTSLLDFLRFLRSAEEESSGPSWSTVVRGLRPFLPDDANRELRRVDSTY